MPTGIEGPHWTEVVVAVTAVVGAVLGLYAAVLSTLQWIRYFRDERVRLQVRLSLGTISELPGSENPKLVITAVNVGKIPVTFLGGAELRINTMEPGRKLAVVHENHAPPLPCRLEPYATLVGWVDLKNLREIELKSLNAGNEYCLTASFHDPSGKDHWSPEHVLTRAEAENSMHMRMAPRRFDQVRTFIEEHRPRRSSRCR
jgi:hypothetical protein